jgi:hypothetical protein
MSNKRILIDNEARVVRNERFDELSKSISLKIRLKVVNEMLIQSYLVEIGHIPDGFWSDRKERKYGRSFRRFASQLTKAQMKEFKKWEKDGRPK